MTEEDADLLKNDIRAMEAEGSFNGLSGDEVVEKIQLHARSAFQSLMSLNLVKKKKQRYLKSKKITRDFIQN